MLHPNPEPRVGVEGAADHVPLVLVVEGREVSPFAGAGRLGLGKGLLGLVQVVVPPHFLGIARRVWNIWSGNLEHVCKYFLLAFRMPYSCSL